MPSDPPPVLCLGEALVDLVGSRAGAALPAAGPFTAHLGGVAANVAVAAARTGAPVALAGGVGEDAWGVWLRERLAAEGVDVTRCAAVPGHPTALAFVTVDAAGEPSYTVRGADTGAMLRAAGKDIEAAVEGAQGLLITTNTLVGAPERAVTMRAHAHAHALERPIVLDANLRLGRWASRAEAIARARDCVAGTLLVRANREEAALITGEADPERAAAELVAAGAQLAVITLGDQGALLRGAARADVPAVAVTGLVNTAGAGDALTGTLLGRLALGGFSAPVVASALAEAVSAAAAACAREGAVD